MFFILIFLFFSPSFAQPSEEKIGQRGNWVKKREWLQRATSRNEKVQKKAAEIKGLVPSFKSKYAAISKELGDFFKNFEIEKEKLQPLFESAAASLEKSHTQKKEAILKSPQKDQKVSKEQLDKIDNELSELKKELAELEREISLVGEFSKAFEARIKKVEEQANIAQAQAQSSATLSEEIWDIIDDTKAEANFNQIKIGRASCRERVYVLV